MSKEQQGRRAPPTLNLHDPVLLRMVSQLGRARFLVHSGPRSTVTSPGWAATVASARRRCGMIFLPLN